jgi:hypothetical protein
VLNSSRTWGLSKDDSDADGLKVDEFQDGASMAPSYFVDEVWIRGKHQFLS